MAAWYVTVYNPKIGVTIIVGVYCEPDMTGGNSYASQSVRRPKSTHESHTCRHVAKPSKIIIPRNLYRDDPLKICSNNSMSALLWNSTILVRVYDPGMEDSCLPSLYAASVSNSVC
jgi:hypothetical protein